MLMFSFIIAIFILMGVTVGKLGKNNEPNLDLTNNYFRQ